jgi:hypothetical protein
VQCRRNGDVAVTSVNIHHLFLVLMVKRLVVFLSIAAVAVLIGTQVTAQETPKAASGQQQDDPLAEFRHPKNLKVLPKNIKPEDLQMTMRTYSRSLGVRCGFCHAMKPAAAGARPQPDFASDAKDEKRNARKMILMTSDINKKYLAKMDRNFEVACVSCHRGNPKPMVSVDSLPKPQERSVPAPMPGTK